MDERLIYKYFPGLDPQQKNQFAALKDLYADWNKKINVVSRKDVEHLYLRHILHSLAIAKYTGFKPGTRIIDVGTGGGFPGIPLAILFPATHFTLLDSVGKKTKVVREVVYALGLDHVRVVNGRAEQHGGKYDYIVSRAVARMDTFVRWTGHLIDPVSKYPLKNGILYLKGGTLDDELADFPQAVVTDISRYFEETHFETKKIVYLPLSPLPE